MSESEGFLDEFIEIEVTVFTEAIKLSCELYNLQIGNSHLSQDLLDALKRDLARVIVLFAEQPECILDVDFIGLWVRFE